MSHLVINDLQKNVELKGLALTAIRGGMTDWEKITLGNIGSTATRTTSGDNGTSQLFYYHLDILVEHTRP